MASFSCRYPGRPCLQKPPPNLISSKTSRYMHFWACFHEIECFKAQNWFSAFGHWTLIRIQYTAWIRILKKERKNCRQLTWSCTLWSSSCARQWRGSPPSCRRTGGRAHRFCIWKLHFCRLTQKNWISLHTIPVLRIPDPNFSIPDPGSATKNLSILTQKIVSILSIICSGMFIPDPDLDFLPIPEPGFNQAPAPGSGAVTLYHTVRIWNKSMLPCYGKIFFLQGFFVEKY